MFLSVTSFVASIAVAHRRLLCWRSITLCRWPKMARARNIKPSFFKNETLVELPFEHRLLFVGLWTLADKEGRLEDRPKRIKMELFPADNVNVEEGLALLHKHGFITRYSAAGVDVVQVVNFSKHQSPHHTEKASELPDINGAFTVKSRKQDGGNPPDSLIPDSLIPDSPNPEPELGADAPDVRAMFAELWERWPSNFGEKGSRKNAEAAYLKLKPDKTTHERILAALDAQITDKSTKAVAGHFCPNFPHVERWIKNRRYDDEISQFAARPAKISRSDEADRAYQEQLARIAGGNPECYAGAEGDGLDLVLAGNH